MKERHIQTEFGQKNTIEGVFELKLVKGKSFAFNRVAEHQIKSLLQVKHGALYYKLIDPMWTGSFAQKRPFDCMYLKNYPAYLVLIWFIPRKKKIAYYIDIDTWVAFVKTHPRKSAREEEIAQIADHIINFNKRAYAKS